MLFFVGKFAAFGDERAIIQDFVGTLTLTAADSIELAVDDVKRVLSLRNTCRLLV
jgi:hypothetical protein